MAMVRELQPGIIVNDRLEIGGDLKTPEQYQPRGWLEVDGKPVVWEACQTLNGSWGYDRDNLDWKSPRCCVRMLIDTRLQGRQPAAQRRADRARRVRPTGARARCAGIGEWMRLHGRSIYGATASDVHAAAGLPLHPARQPALPAPLRLAVPARPPRRAGGQGRVRPAAERRLGGQDAGHRPRSAGAEHDHGRPAADTLTLELPIQPPPVAVPVIELFLKG